MAQEPASKGELQNPIPLGIGMLAPTPDIFDHHSELHGQTHVSRVIIHAFLLTGLLGHDRIAPRIWAAAYLHDIGRRHDGVCYEHGRLAVERLDRLPEVKSRLELGGVCEGDWDAIFFAVVNHCRAEVPMSHPHRTLTAVLKDADGLDRVRLGDLDPRYLRFPESQSLVSFAEALYRETHRRISPGPDHFAALWPVAARLYGEITDPR